MGGGSSAPALFARAANLHSEAEGSRSSSGGSPPRGIALGDEKDRSVNSDEALYVVEEEVPGSRKDKKSLGNSRDGIPHVNARGNHTGGGSSTGGGGDVFDRLPYNYTESERKRRQPDALATSARQPFSTRRSSQDKEAVALSAASAAAAAAATAGLGASGAVPMVASRRSVEVDPGGTRSDDRGGR